MKIEREHKGLRLKKEKIFSIFDHIMPIYFIENFFANVISYYITGNTYEFIRKFLSWGMIFVLFIVAGVILLGFKEYMNRKNSFIMFPFFLIFITIILGILRLNFDVFALKKLILFILYCFPAFIIAIYICFQGKTRILISNFKWIGLLMTPFFLQSSISFIAMSFTEEYHKQFGGITYLGISYAAFVVLIFCLTDLLVIALLRDQDKLKNAEKIDLVVISICAVTSVANGSRGAFLSVICGYLIITFLCLKKKIKDKYLFIALILIPVAICMVFFTTNILGTKDNRITTTIDEVRNNNLKDAIQSDESEIIVQEIMQEGEKGKKFEDYGYTEEQNNNEDLEKSINNIKNGSMARVYLYRIALREANDHWLFGMGPLGYQAKYGTYPHNVILEVLADFGYPVAILFLLFSLYIVKTMFRYSKDHVCNLGLFIISLCQVIKMMLSSEIYVEMYMIFIITFVLALRAKDKS